MESEQPSKDIDDDKGHYVVVDKRMIIRCEWCGIFESPKWLAGKNHFYCSKECQYAHHLPKYLDIQQDSQKSHLPFQDISLHLFLYDK